MNWIKDFIPTMKKNLTETFGGVKDSGVGREGGMWSIGFFSEAVNICVMED